MIESNDKQAAQAGSEKHQPVQSLASEVYQWGSHKLDDAKAWAKEHPKAATAAEVTTLAAGAGLVFLATKGHGGQAMAADAVSEAAALGAKTAGGTAAREVGAAGAKAVVELGASDAALSARALNANLGTDIGRVGTQALAGDAGSLTGKLLGTGVTQDSAALARATGGSLDANLTKSVIGDADVAAKTAVTSGDATVSAAKGGLPNADLTAKAAADAEHHGIFSGRLGKLAIGLPVMTLGALSLAGCNDNGSSDNSTSDSSTPANPEDEKPEAARVYQTPDECAKDGVFTKNFCETQFEAAQKTHMEVAPKFQSKEECEDETGTKCEAAPAPDASTLVANPSAGGNSDSPTTTSGKPGDGTVVAGNGQPGDATVSANGTQTVVVHDHNSGGWFMPYMMGYMIGHNSGSVSSGYTSDRDRDRSTAGGSGYIARPLYSSPGATSGTSSGFITPEGRNIGTRTGAVEVPAATMSRSTIGSSAHGEAGHATGVSRGAFGAGRGGAFGFGG